MDNPTPSARPAPAIRSPRRSTRGWCKKTRAADDGRAVALLLTPAGIELPQCASQSLLFAGNAVSALPPAMQEALLNGLLPLIGQLQRNERFPEIRTCFSCRHFQPNRHADAEAPHHCGQVNAPLPLRLLWRDCPGTRSRRCRGATR